MGNLRHAIGILGGNWQNLVFGRFAEAVEVTYPSQGVHQRSTVSLVRLNLPRPPEPPNYCDAISRYSQARA